MMMSEKCSDSDGETLLEKLFKTRVDPAEVFNYPFNIPTKQEIPTNQEYPSNDWLWSSSFGLSSEKVTLSFYDVSLFLYFTFIISIKVLKAIFRLKYFK